MSILSDVEIWEIELKAKAYADPIRNAIDLTAKAQDAKTARELIQELEKPCEEHAVESEEVDGILHDFNIDGWFWKHRKDCPQCWAEIKKEYGL